MAFELLTSLSSIAVTLMYLFNINVGTAVLTMPIAFQQTGWLLSTFILTFICFISFVTVTFQIECISIANAVSYLMRTKPELFNEGLVEKQQEEDNSTIATTEDDILEEKQQEGEEDEKTSVVVTKEDSSELTAVKEPQITYGTVNSIETAESNIEEEYNEDIFEMRQSFDLTDVAELFLEKFGRIIYQTLTCIYLYGTVSLFCAVVSITLCDMSCTFKHINPAIALTDSDPCWHSMGITRGQSYRVFVLFVFLALGPFTFCKIENTLLFQTFSSLFRITIFVVMITLTITSMITGKAEGTPIMANIWSAPNLIGIAIYAFICQHAFPSVISSISNKKHLLWSTFAGYLLILSFYFLLSYTAVFTFPYLKDVYTLNFMNNRCDENEYSVIPRVMFLELLIPLYPVIAFSTNLQINSMTLKNNLLSLITSCSDPCQTEATATFNRKVVLPLLAVIPPFVIAMTTTNMVMLVSVVGIYAGLLAQCVIPSMLLISARKTVNIYCEKNEEFKNLMSTPNKYKSPFSHSAVLYFMFIWSFLCIACMTVALIL